MVYPAERKYRLESLSSTEQNDKSLEEKWLQFLLVHSLLPKKNRSYQVFVLRFNKYVEIASE